MPQRHGHQRQHRSPPVIRRPRVPGGQRLVRAHGWLTTDYPQACWYRITQRSPDWSQCGCRSRPQLEDEPVELRCGGAAQRLCAAAGDAVPAGGRVRSVSIATAIRAGQRGADD